ncbi:PREDICTED: uncharacterized protein LOC106814849 [Priapulus caudatus]|uniref:Uncharacterized protein LOC106814849 n=1 Tax=Priapulus caudatus TaxID=37621 RepID=A0ABM1ER78_PRICU|nr:PREDICTED: uncharacterized protein LOC106814849 [Priapulus caudatus]
MNLSRKVSKYFKYGNLMLFARDLENQLADLMFTKEKLHQYEVGSPLLGKSFHFSPPDGMTQQTIDTQIVDIQEILKAVRPHLNRSRLDSRLASLRRGLLTGSRQCSVEELSGPGPSRTVRTLCYAGRFTKGNALYTKLPYDCEGATMHDGGDDAAAAYNPKLLTTSSPRRCFDRELRPLHGLCEAGATEGVRRMHSLHQRFSRDAVALWMEKTERGCLDPEVGMLTFGGCLTANFLCNMDSSPIGGSTRRPSTQMDSDDSADSFHSCSGSEVASDVNSADDDSGEESDIEVISPEPDDVGGALPTSMGGALCWEATAMAGVRKTWGAASAGVGKNWDATSAGVGKTWGAASAGVAKTWGGGGEDTSGDEASDERSSDEGAASRRESAAAARRRHPSSDASTTVDSVRAPSDSDEEVMGGEPVGMSGRDPPEEISERGTRRGYREGTRRG